MQNNKIRVYSKQDQRKKYFISYKTKNMFQNINKTLQKFAPISLDQLNASVSFLDRIEIKFLLHEAQLEEVLLQLQDQFYILEIAGHTTFSYENVYMDSKNYDFYYQHANGQDHRLKVRSRLYRESHYSFFECNQKSWKTARKFRLQQQEDQHGTLYQELIWFYNGVYQTLYGIEPIALIFPALKTSYQRITLCSKNNDERLTIDFNISFEDLRANKNQKKKEISLENFVMIESKSMSSHCVSHDIMWAYGFERASSCSKYCLGLYYFEKIQERSRFQKSINQIEKIRRTTDYTTLNPNSQQLIHQMLPNYEKKEVNV